MKAAIVKETYPGERRVALVPANLAALQKAGLEVLVESGAGAEAGFPDEAYRDKGALVVAERSELFLQADMVLQVRSYGANLQQGTADLGRMRSGQVMIGSCDPLGQADSACDLAQTGVSQFALELIPRITRAQSMDILSSMATIAGYRAVLLAAVELPKLMPMLMTAAGTLRAARVFVIGAGVAGLQAMATAKRLGGIVQAYDVRPATRDQVESVGAKFVELELQTDAAEDKGGYAKTLGEEFYQKQRELMARVVAECDIVIATAAIPGKPSPLLITAEAVAGMRAGSVIVDLAAERGGNCALSQADRRVVEHGVVILGPTNLASEVPHQASQMYSNNMTRFVLNLVKEGKLDLNLDDEIIADTLITHGGDVVHARLRETLGMEPLQRPALPPEADLVSAPLATESDLDQPISLDDDEPGTASPASPPPPTDENLP